MTDNPMAATVDIIWEMKLLEISTPKSFKVAAILSSAIHRKERFQNFIIEVEQKIETKMSENYFRILKPTTTIKI